MDVVAISSRLGILVMSSSAADGEGDRRMLATIMGARMAVSNKGIVRLLKKMRNA